MVFLNAAVVSVETVFSLKGQIIIIQPRKLKENRQNSCMSGAL